MKLGFIGVGHLSTSIIRGLLESKSMSSDRIVLSPRGNSDKLSREYGFEVAKDNADLVQICDTVLLAVRPKDATSVVAGLPWRSNQILMSACAGVSINELSSMASGATIVRIMPTIASEFGASATLIYPHQPELKDFLSAIGKAIILDREDQFEVGTVSAAIFGWIQALILASSDWSTRNGMDAVQARALLSQTIIAAGTVAAEKNIPLSDIILNLATPGGITEAGLRHLEECQTMKSWEEACNIVMDKLHGKVQD